MNPHIQKADHLCLQIGCGGPEMLWEMMQSQAGVVFWRKWAGLCSTLVMISQVYTYSNPLENLVYVGSLYMWEPCICNLEYVGSVES